MVEYINLTVSASLLMETLTDHEGHTCDELLKILANKFMIYFEDQYDCDEWIETAKSPVMRRLQRWAKNDVIYKETIGNEVFWYKNDPRSNIRLDERFTDILEFAVRINHECAKYVERNRDGSIRMSGQVTHYRKFFDLLEQFGGA